MALIDRVRFDALSDDVLAWKFPNENFKLSSQPIVDRSTMCAVANRLIAMVLCGVSMAMFFVAPVAIGETSQSTYVVAQDNALLFYSSDGKPTSSEHLTKGTYIRVEKLDGDVVFTTYNGEPAYIRLAFLAKPEPVLVVAEDDAQLFYHRDGHPTGVENLAKGTRINFEDASGDRVFTTYNGKPAYIHSEFLTTEKLFFESEQRAKGLVQYKSDWVTPAEKFRREQMDKGLVEYRDQWVTPETKANLEKGLVQYNGEWVTPEEKFRREQTAKGLVEYQGQWVTPDVKANLEKGLVEYNGAWVTPQQKEKLERERLEAERRAAAERNLANLTTAVMQGDYTYASQFVGSQYPLPPIAQLDQRLRSWVEKAGALQQASSAVGSTKRLAAQESARVLDAQTSKYETYYTDENVTFTCTWCGGRGVALEGCIGCPGGDTAIWKTCPVCGGSGQLTRRIPVKKKRKLPQETVSMGRLNALQEDLRKQEAQLDVFIKEERARRNALVSLLPPTDQPTSQSSLPSGFPPGVKSESEIEGDFEKTLRELFPDQYQATAQPSFPTGARSVSQTAATPSIRSEGREAETTQPPVAAANSQRNTEGEGLRKRLNAVNERMTEIFDALQQSASIPTEQLMANAMNGGKAYTDRYNARNEALKREWGTLEKEKADLERQLAAIGDRDSEAQIAERSKRADPRYVADDYVQLLIDGGSVKSARYLDTKAMFDGVFVVYWFDYVTKAGLRREGQYVVRLRKGNTGEWEVFNSYSAESPIP